MVLMILIEIIILMVIIIIDLKIIEKQIVFLIEKNLLTYFEPGLENLE